MAFEYEKILGKDNNALVPDKLPQMYPKINRNMEQLKGIVAGQDSSINNHAGRLQAAEATIIDHENRIDSAEATIANHESRLDAAEPVIADHETRLDTAEFEIDVHETRLDGHDADITERDQILTELQASSNDLEVIAARGGYPSLDARLDAIDPGVMFRTKKFEPTQGQTVFSISDMGEFTVGAGKTAVYVGPNRQFIESGNYTETNSTTITLSEGVPDAGLDVVVQWVEGNVSIRSGHHRTHEEGGADELHISKLKGYDEFLNGLKLNIIESYKASGSLKSTTGTMTQGSPILTLASPIDFENGQGIAVNKAGALCTLAAPASPTVTNAGTAGTTAYQYQIVAIDKNGGMSAAGTVGVTATGNAVLSDVDYNALSWAAVTGAAAYGIYGRNSGAMTLMALTEETTWNDKGIKEIATLTISTAPTASGNVTITLNGVSFTVGILSTDTAAGVATKIRAAAYAGWTTGGTGTTVTFTSDSAGNKADATYNPGSTGAGLSTNMKTTAQGEITQLMHQSFPASPPASATTGNLYTTIVSGEGTTSLLLANPAITSVSAEKVYHDDTEAFNNAINDLNAWTDASINGLRSDPTARNYRGGRIDAPEGAYNVRNINLKSGIMIQGDGVAATRFNPIGVGGYVFDRDNSEQWLSLVTLQDFTVAPNDEHFAFTPKLKNMSAMGAFNFNLTSQVNMSRVYILNVGGMGLALAECYDSYFDKMELIGVGCSTSKPAIAMYPGIDTPGGRDASVIDLTNAVHMAQIRVENCFKGLDIDGSKNVNKLEREIQFSLCKFEGSPVHVKHVVGVKFSDCNFTAHGAFEKSQGSIPHIVVGEVGSYDTRGIEFNNCSYFSGTSNTRWMFEFRGISTYDVKINGGSVTNLKNFVSAVGNNFPIVITNLSVVNCGTPFIEVTKKLILMGSTFYQMLGTDYVIIAGEESDIAFNHFKNSSSTKMAKGISMTKNCHSFRNHWENVSEHAHFVSDGGNVIERQRYETGTVTKEIEYANATLYLVTFYAKQLTNAAPGMYNKTPNITSTIGANGNYGAPTAITPDNWSYFTNPNIKMNIGAGFAGETITIKIDGVYDDADATVGSITKSFTAASNAWLTLDELSPLIQTRRKLVALNVYAKTTSASTAVAISVQFIMNIH
jgi:hypothetical protein